MAALELSGKHGEGRVAIIDDHLLPLLAGETWIVNDCKGSKYPMRRGRAGEPIKVYLHREVARILYGDIPEGHVVHHNNGDTFEVTEANLSVMSARENHKYQQHRRAN